MPEAEHKTGRWAALGGAILLTIALPIAIDQGYLRYNAYALPCLALVAVLLYLGFIAGHPSTIRFIRYHPKKTFVVALFVLFGLVVGFRYVLGLSKKHVAEQLARDSQPTPTPTPTPTASPSPTADAKASPTAEHKREHKVYSSPTPSAADIAKEFSKLIPTQTGESETEKIRAEALSVIRGLSSIFDVWEHNDHEWQESKSPYSVILFQRQNNNKEFSDRYNNDYRDKAIAARDSLLGRVRNMPERRGDIERAYQPPQFPGELVHATDVETQMCDLIILLNAMERENSLAPSALDIGKKHYCY